MKYDPDKPLLSALFSPSSPPTCLVYVGMPEPKQPRDSKNSNKEWPCHLSLISIPVQIRPLRDCESSAVLQTYLLSSSSSGPFVSVRHCKATRRGKTFFLGFSPRSWGTAPARCSVSLAHLHSSSLQLHHTSSDCSQAAVLPAIHSLPMAMVPFLKAAPVHDNFLCCWQAAHSLSLRRIPALSWCTSWDTAGDGLST